MKLEQYIEELLYRYNCVILPDFGAFLTQSKSAFIKESTHTFYPPSKVISFNELLTSNDGLLVSYIADAERTTYEVMLKRLGVVSKNWKEQLQNGERLNLENIGKLWLNNEGKILFEPSVQNNYLTSSFGLSSCVSAQITREILKEQVELLEDKIPFIITPEQREKNSFRPYLKYAAVAFIGVAAGLSALRFYNDNISSQQFIQQTVQKKVSRHIEEATFFDTAPLELPPLNLNVKVDRENQTTFYIVAGAFKVRTNAEKKIMELKAKGFNSNYIGVNKFGFHVVSFDSFTEVNKALNFLKTIKREVSSDAWLFQD